MGTHNVNMGGLIKALGQLPHQVEDACVRGCRSAAVQGVTLTVANIGTRNPGEGTPPAVHTGDLMRSVRYERTEKGGSITVDAPHAPFVEYGTRPHWPPTQPILDWVKAKFGLTGQQAEQAAFSIRAKIAAHGTKPRFFMRRTVQQLTKGGVVFREIEKELRKLP